jgi:hypothetical protein
MNLWIKAHVINFARKIVIQMTTYGGGAKIKVLNVCGLNVCWTYELGIDRTTSMGWTNIIETKLKHFILLIWAYGF